MKKENKKNNSRLYFEISKLKLAKSNRSQITIFIIIAIILIASIMIIFYAAPKNITTISITGDPQGYIQDCAKKAAADAADKIIPNSGFLNPRKGSYTAWKGEKAVFFCYTPEYDATCTNNHPMIGAEMEKEIYNQILPKIENCFSQIKSEFEKFNYKAGDLILAVELSPGKVNLKINRKISYTKNDLGINLEHFNTQIKSPLYDFAIISTDVVREEVEGCDCGESNCNADIMAINGDKREYATDRDIDAYNNKIYTLTEVASGKKFNFAVRNCVTAPIL